jgi:hypothetical protein
MEINMYLQSILNKYAPRSLDTHKLSILLLKADLQTWASSCYISILKADLQTWASSCYISILNSGSRAKGTAISMASDVDYLISLTSNCNAKSGGLKSIYN